MLPIHPSKQWLSKPKPLCIFVLFLILLISTQVSATDIRGRIDGQHAYSSSRFPVRSARISFYYWTGKKWVSAGKAFTGPDGMYYMKNLRPGNYTLQVNDKQNFSITIRNSRFQDIPSILIRY